LTERKIQALEELLTGLGRVKIAISGGVDSMTLGILAGRALSSRPAIYHALSPAVPPAATARVQESARAEGWDLHLVNAGEFGDEAYLSNPYRRCFHCKHNLYAALAGEGTGTILSGTNTDDMDDFRPGLQAAAQFAVRHPFVECGVDKAGIRRICRRLGYPKLAELPAAPCLSSRVETGIRIQPAVLGFIDRVESSVRDALRPAVVRCRVRRDVIAVQLDPGSLTALTSADTGDWAGRIGALAEPLGLPTNVCFEPYRMGSAFVQIT
jgi:uncharacterized protein